MIPGWLLVVVLLVALAVIVGMWLSGMASRLNRLHIRTDSARLNLEGALQGVGGPRPTAMLGGVAGSELLPAPQIARPPPGRRRSDVAAATAASFAWPARSTKKS